MIISVITIGSFLLNTVFIDTALAVGITPAKAESSQLRPLATESLRDDDIAGALSGLSITSESQGRKVIVEVTSKEASQMIELQRVHEYSSRIDALKQSIESRGGGLTPLSDSFWSREARSGNMVDDKSNPVRKTLKRALYREVGEVGVLIWPAGYEALDKAMGRYAGEMLYLAEGLKIVEACLVAIHEIWHGEMQEAGKSRKCTYSFNEENPYRAEFRLGNNYLDMVMTLRETTSSFGEESPIGDYLNAYADELELGVISLRYLAIASNMLIFADRVRGRKPNAYYEQAARAVDEIREPVIDTDFKDELKRLIGREEGLNSEIRARIDSLIVEHLTRSALREIEAAKAVGPQTEEELKLVKEIIEKDSQSSDIVKAERDGGLDAFKGIVISAADPQDRTSLDERLNYRTMGEGNSFDVQTILEILLSKVTDPVLRGHIAMAVGILMIGGKVSIETICNVRKQAGMALAWYRDHRRVRKPKELNPLLDSLLFELARHKNSSSAAYEILGLRVTGSADDFGDERLPGVEGTVNILFLLALEEEERAIDYLKKAAEYGELHDENETEAKRLNMTVKEISISNRRVERIRSLSREALGKIKGCISEVLWKEVEAFLKRLGHPVDYAENIADMIDSLTKRFAGRVNAEELAKTKAALQAEAAAAPDGRSYARLLAWADSVIEARFDSEKPRTQDNPPCIYVHNLRRIGMPEGLIRFIISRLDRDIEVVDRPWEEDIPGTGYRLPLIEIDGEGLHAPPLPAFGETKDNGVRGFVPGGKMSSSGQKQAPVNPIRPLIENPALGSFIESFLTKRYSSWGLAEDLAERTLNTLKSYAEDPETARRKVYEEVIDFETDRDWQRAYDRYKETTKYTTTYSQIRPFIESLPEGTVIIDAGCGNNALGREIVSANPGMHVIGTDPYDYHEEYRLSNLKFQRQTNPQKLPFKKNFADVVIMNAALHHVENPEKFLDEIKRVLKLGGRLILVEDTYSCILAIDDTAVGNDEVDAELTERFLELISKHGENFARDFFTFIDWYGNIVVHKWAGMAIPYNFHSIESWKQILKQRGFIMTGVRHMGFPKSSFHKPNTGVMVFMSLESTDLPVFRPEDGHKRTLAISQAA